MKFLISLILVTSLYADIKTITTPTFLAYVGHVGTLCIDGYKFVVILPGRGTGTPGIEQMYRDVGMGSLSIPQPIKCKDE